MVSKTKKHRSKFKSGRFTRQPGKTLGKVIGYKPKKSKKSQN